jgi:hypothetical protein
MAGLSHFFGHAQSKSHSGLKRPICALTFSAAKTRLGHKAIGDGRSKLELPFRAHLRLRPLPYGGFRTPAMVPVERSALAGIRNPSKTRRAHQRPDVSFRRMRTCSARGLSMGGWQVQSTAIEFPPFRLLPPGNPRRARIGGALPKSVLQAVDHARHT